MVKIAIHAPRVTYYCGGAERYILNSLIELSKKHRNLSLISYDAPEKTEWFKEFLKKFKGDIYLLKSKKIDKNFNEFKFASKPTLWDKESKIFGEEIYKFYKENKFDITVCHYTVDCFHLPSNTKIILHLHGLPDKKRKIENQAIKIPDKIIAVSNYVAKGWKEIHKIKKRIHIIPNGIFLDRNQYFRNEREEDIIYFGRLIKIKGVDILLKSIKLLKKENIFPRVVIIGEGPEKENLINLAKDIGIKNIFFLGKTTDKELFNYIASSKISVFPSYKREGIMTTILEASKFGSAIIASNSCSNKEFIKNKYNGLLFEQKNYKELSKIIKEALFNESLRKKLARNSIETLREFSWKKQAKRLSKIYF